MSPRGKRRAAIYVEVDIVCPIERVWELTQNTDAHPSWDLRSSRITPIGDLDGGGYRFRYERSLLVHTLRGLVSRSVNDVVRTGRGRLRFVSTHGRSAVADGRRTRLLALPVDCERDDVHPGYDDEPGFGRFGVVLDRLLTRRGPWWTVPFLYLGKGAEHPGPTRRIGRSVHGKELPLPHPFGRETVTFVREFEVKPEAVEQIPRDDDLGR